MMQAKEFRIGNWVMGNAPFQIGPNDIPLAYHYEKWKESPRWGIIRLTAEWLLKLGFEKIKNKPGTQGVYSNGKINLTLSNSGNIYWRHKLIPYVHRLQNLYFVLYDEEL